MLPFIGEYFLVKNHWHPWIPSRDIHDQRMLQSDWAIEFYPKICEAEFSQVLGLHSARQRIVRCFILSQFQQKVIKKFCENSRKLISCQFWILYIHLRPNKFFFWRIQICHFFQFIAFYFRAKFWKKLANRFREKPVTDVRMDVKIDGCLERHEFIGHPLPGRGLIKISRLSHMLRVPTQ